MEELNELTRKKSTKIEGSKTKKSSPPTPVIETPVPPQDMNPSVLPDHIERQKPLAVRRKKKSETPRKAS